MLKFRGFGAPVVERDGLPLEGAARQRRVIALVALLVSARDRGLSRDRVLALLWPESDPEHARQALTQALYHARRSLGEDRLFVASADLRLNAEVMTADLWDFQDALRENRDADAASIQTAPFLEGFFLSGLPEFEQWVSEERRRLALQLSDALARLAVEAEAAGSWHVAVTLRRQRAALDPLNSRYAVDLMAALAQAGELAGALQYARIHEALLQQQLGIAPPEEVSALAERLRDEAVERTSSPDGAGPSEVRIGAIREPATLPAELPDSGRDGVAAESTARDTRTAPVLRFRVRRWRAMLGVSLLLGSVVAAVYFATRARAPVERELLVVTPFRVSGAEPALAYLREGLVDLLSTKLEEDSSTHAADPGSVMNAWHRAGLDGEAATSHADAVAVARRLGGARLVVGSVVGTPARVVITASLLGVADGALQAQASVEGPSDSLTILVDRLVARLVAMQAGTRLADHTTTSARALRVYLRGQSDFRRGRYRESVRQFRSALDDDPTFALAGLGLAQAADRIGLASDVARGLDAAWASRGDLRERDRAYLQALAGPRYPDASSERERLEAWERATAAAPERADVWHEFGKRLFHDGRLLGITDWRQRANAAFRRAIEIDTAFASPLQYVLQLAAADGDTAEVRSVASAYLSIDSVGELAGFVRWRAAAALLDTASLRRIRRSFNSLPSASLRMIALSSVSNGVEIEDARRALVVLRGRAVRGAEQREVLLAEHAVALNRGDASAARNALRALATSGPQPALAERLRVLDALYGPGGSAGRDSVAASIAERILARLPRDARVPSPATIPGPSREDVCVGGQWYAWRGPSQEAMAFREELAVASASDDRPDVFCAALIESIVTVRQGAAGAAEALARYDSLLATGPVSEAMVGYAYLALARLYALQGDSQHALSVAGRRPHLTEWPRYLATQLREEGRLAAAVRDTARAVRAFRHYLKLRAAADDDLRAEVDSVRVELERIDSGRR